MRAARPRCRPQLVAAKAEMTDACPIGWFCCRRNGYRLAAATLVTDRGLPSRWLCTRKPLLLLCCCFNAAGGWR